MQTSNYVNHNPDHHTVQDSLAHDVSIHHSNPQVSETTTVDSLNAPESAIEVGFTAHSQEVITCHTKHLTEQQGAAAANSAATSYSASPATSEADWTSPTSTVVLEDSVNTEKRIVIESITVPGIAIDRVTQAERGFSFAGPNINVVNGNPAPNNTQNALLLYAVKEKYTLVTDYAAPSVIHDGEILIKVTAIGLNPIDWKALLPWIFGRDFAGVVIQASSIPSRLKVGDIVLVPSTDYRDIRKAGFQEYAVTTHYNAAQIPLDISIHCGASLGVAFVTTTLALGISFGLDFSSVTKVPGPNLPQFLKEVNIEQILADVRDECFSSAPQSEWVQQGDWIAIWGASTTTGYITLQLAKLYGLRVICTADIARHGAKLHEAGADLLGALSTHEPDGSHAHLLGLTGLPKERNLRIRYHAVPIKTFHAVPAVGESFLRHVSHCGQELSHRRKDLAERGGTYALERNLCRLLADARRPSADASASASS
ncbi:hypothetical protein B7463_g9984, partial [Scytalidium lignicola]